MKIINLTPELFPLCFICCCVVRRYPNTKDVVDVAFVAENVGGVFGEDTILMDGKEQVCIGGSRRGPHGGAGLLVPECITKLEHVVPHDDSEGFQKGGGGDGGEPRLALVDVLGYLDEGHLGFMLVYIEVASEMNSLAPGEGG